ncbi:MAG: ATP-binding protein [Actinomycetota bacterium]|jgi:cell division protease FtsH|nr:ATP-binding protein [Actinomycetota bacterium]
MTAPSPDEAREFLRTFRSFLEWVHQPEDRAHPVASLLRGHLGDRGEAQSVVTASLPAFEHVNLQVALDAWTAEPGRTVRVKGLSMPPHFGGISLSQLLHGTGLPPVTLSAPDVVDLPSGPGRTHGCWNLALLLVEDARGRGVLLVAGPQRHEEPRLVVEVAGLATGAAQEVLRELAELRDRLDVYRGQVVELRPGPAGPTLVFAELPPTGRDDVVLPEDVLRRVERHTLDVARQRDRLRATGRHLKRGLLLYGPPGTGKTHTTRYLVQALQGTTVLLLSGSALMMIGAVADLARKLQPSVVVLEDVDLVAEDRSFGPGSSPVLFELLDAMDGSAADADLLFLLTTNRADLLEPALAARPGRVDVAVEIGLPDDEARRRLLEVHGRGLVLDLSEDDLRDAVERTHGVTASFLKELLRRAVLEALEGAVGPDSDPPTVTGAHLSRALDDLLDASQSVTRALLGVPADQNGPPSPPVPDFWPGGRMSRGVVYGGSYGPGLVEEYVEYD